MKDTGGRAREVLQLKVENFDFGGEFVKITFTRKITKGKSTEEAHT